MMFQHSTSLYNLKVNSSFLNALLYQFFLAKFPIYDVIAINEFSPSENLLTLLRERREILQHHFSIELEDQNLLKFPCVFSIIPTKEQINLFLQKLQNISLVDWQVEKTCLSLILTVLSEIYVEILIEILSEEEKAREFWMTWISPLIKTLPFYPQKNACIELALLTDLRQLYKIFERC